VSPWLIEGQNTTNGNSSTGSLRNIIVSMANSTSLLYPATGHVLQARMDLEMARGNEYRHGVDPSCAECR
jgi:hypothetical protein